MLLLSRRNAAHAAARMTAGAAALLAATACGDGGAEPAGAGRALVGRWESDAEPISPRGSWRRSLVVRPDMRVERSGVTYGLYAGDGPATVSASFTLYGRLGATESKFVIRPDSVVTVDRFGGSPHREVQRELVASPYDSVEYTIRGDILELAFYTYPADAPVLTRDVMHRVR